MVRVNWYDFAKHVAYPAMKALWGYQIIGKENLIEASKGKVVVITTHASPVGGLAVGLAESLVLDDEPYLIIHKKWQKNIAHYFLDTMNIIWVNGIWKNKTQKSDDHLAVRQIGEKLLEEKTRGIIIASQGELNIPDSSKVHFHAGGLVGAIYAVRRGAEVYVVPGYDCGVPYGGKNERRMPMLGKRIKAIFGEPIRVTIEQDPRELTTLLEDRVKDLMRKYS